MCFYRYGSSATTHVEWIAMKKRERNREEEESIVM